MRLTALSLVSRIAPQFAVRVAQRPVTTPRRARRPDLGDLDTPHVAGEAMARRHPRAALRSTTGLGHRRIRRDPGVVGTVVEFLTHHSRQAAAAAA